MTQEAWTSAVGRLKAAAIKDGVSDDVGAEVAHLDMLARQAVVGRGSGGGGADIGGAVLRCTGCRREFWPTDSMKVGAKCPGCKGTLAVEFDHTSQWPGWERELSDAVLEVVAECEREPGTNPLASLVDRVWQGTPPEKVWLAVAGSEADGPRVSSSGEGEGRVEVGQVYERLGPRPYRLKVMVCRGAWVRCAVQIDGMDDKQLRQKELLDRSLYRLVVAEGSPGSGVVVSAELREAVAEALTDYCDATPRGKWRMSELADAALAAVRQDGER